MNKKILLILLATILLILVACTASANEFLNTANQQGEIAGFWKGLWHGLLAPFAFIVSLFKDGISIYEVHNNGAWYNFGFLFGLTIILGGGCKGTCSRKKC